MKTNLLILVNEKIVEAEISLLQADCDNLVERCRQYLELLSEYSDRLYQVRGTPEINLQHSSAVVRVLIHQVRLAIRTAVENSNHSYTLTESLLNSLTLISESEAVRTFNQLEYKGFTDWDLDETGIFSAANTGEEFITVDEAVATAGMLRRQAYIADRTIF